MVDITLEGKDIVKGMDVCLLRFPCKPFRIAWVNVQDKILSLTPLGKFYRNTYRTYTFEKFLAAGYVEYTDPEYDKDVVENKMRMRADANVKGREYKGGRFEKSRRVIHCNLCNAEIGTVNFWSYLERASKEIDEDKLIDLEATFKCWRCGKFVKIVR